METVEILSRDVFIKRIRLESYYSLYYQIRPNRHSVNCSIWIKNLNTKESEKANDNQKKRTLNSSDDVAKLLLEDGFQLAEDLSSCQPGRFVSGILNLAQSEPMIAALVIDNTFSKSKSKHASYFLGVLRAHNVLDSTCIAKDDFGGWLLKKGRKRLQGWSRRLFWLNPMNRTLHYYKLRDSGPVLRGSLPLDLAAISLRRNGLFINIDSGTHVWNLKAESIEDFEYWRNILSVTHNQESTELSDLNNELWNQVRECIFDLDRSLKQKADFSKIEEFVARLKESIESRDYLMKSSIFDNDETSSMISWHDAVSFIDMKIHSDEDKDSNETKSINSIESDRKIMENDTLYPLGIDENITKRSHLSMPGVKPPGLISFLSKNVGKEISSLSMHVTFNEPLSILQKLAEDLEYSELLDTASVLPPEKRIVYVAAFLVSTISSFRYKDRCIRKPFNPLLGETYEFVSNEKNLRFIAEKVSHRPVILATRTDSPLWNLQATFQPSQKFWGRSAELTALGQYELSFSDGHTYKFSKPRLYLQNIAFGEKYIHPSGSVSITCETLPMKAIVHFYGSSHYKLNYKQVHCEFYRSGIKLNMELVGTWTKSLQLNSHDEKSKAEKVWETIDLDETNLPPYAFSKFASQLNDFTDKEINFADTDSRWRPDIRCLEDGQINSAESFKLKLEKRQRECLCEPGNKEFQPRWFHFESDTSGTQIWRLNHNDSNNYWKVRQSKGFEMRELPRWSMSGM